MKVIKEIHKNWKPLVDAQRSFKGCTMFSGNENFDEIVDLLLSIQGIEFCVKNNFPELEYFERFDIKKASEKGIYINAGTIELENQETVLLVGKTDAVLKYNNLDKAYRVILMHNATAEITADNYAVVSFTGDEDNVSINVSNNAIVI
jgi:hypothetical protein